jgi:hypothetical protein
MIVAGQRLPVLIATRPVDFRCCHQAENNPCNNAEGKQAINWTRLSCKGMAQNEVRLRLHALPTILVYSCKAQTSPRR